MPHPLFHAAWYPLIATRHSRRSYDTHNPPDPGKLRDLEEFCLHFTPYPHARVALVHGKGVEEIYHNFILSYGIVTNPPATFLFIATGDAYAELGYTGECAVLEAKRLGFDSCWVAGTFRKAEARKFADLAPDEHVVAVAPFGNALPKRSATEKAMSGLFSSRKRKQLPEICPQLKQNPALWDTWPEWVQAALQAARIAPSGENTQSWRFYVTEDHSIQIHYEMAGHTITWPAPLRRLDCGIAMAHIEIAAYTHRLYGTWTFYPSPQVACFTPYSCLLRAPVWVYPE